MQNCPPRSLPQALGGGPPGGARLRVSDTPAFDIRSVTAGVRRVHHRVPRFGFWRRETPTFRTCLFFASESDLHCRSMFRVSSATSDPTRRVSAP